MEHLMEHVTSSVLLIVVCLWNCHLVNLMTVSLCQRKQSLMEIMVRTCFGCHGPFFQQKVLDIVKSPSCGTCLLLTHIFSLVDNDVTKPCVEEENMPPISSEDVLKLLTGRMKGVQGHCNSCYMDSALFRFELALNLVKLALRVCILC